MGNAIHCLRVIRKIQKKEKNQLASAVIKKGKRGRGMPGKKTAGLGGTYS